MFLFGMLGIPFVTENKTLWAQSHENASKQLLRIIGRCEWNSREDRSSLILYQGAGCSKEIFEVYSPSRRAIILDYMSRNVEKSSEFAGLPDDINIPLYAFEMKWSTETDSLKRNMKLMQYGIKGIYSGCTPR